MAGIENPNSGQGIDEAAQPIVDGVLPSDAAVAIRPYFIPHPNAARIGEMFASLTAVEATVDEEGIARRESAPFSLPIDGEDVSVLLRHTRTPATPGDVFDLPDSTVEVVAADGGSYGAMRLHYRYGGEGKFVDDTLDIVPIYPEVARVRVFVPLTIDPMLSSDNEAAEFEAAEFRRRNGIEESLVQMADTVVGFDLATAPDLEGKSAILHIYIPDGYRESDAVYGQVPWNRGLVRSLPGFREITSMIYRKEILPAGVGNN